MKKKISLGILILLIGIQFIPVKKNQSDAIADFSEIYNEKKEEISLLETSCYDCHSNNTHYPFYNRIAPVSWYLSKHINNGKKHLNFSAWSEYDNDKKAHKIEECIEVLEEDKMPLWSYTLIHQDAKLSEGQKETLIQFFKQLK